MLRQGEPPTPPEKPKRVDPDYFKRRAALRAERERRGAMNGTLRPGDRVRLPERTADLVWEVRSVDTTARRLELVTVIFESRQQLAADFEDATIARSGQCRCGRC
jgi:hypothetical protein